MATTVPAASQSSLRPEDRPESNLLLDDNALELLSSDLKVDLEAIKDRLKTCGSDQVKGWDQVLAWETTARILGYDVSNYDHLQLAGRMLLYQLKTDPSTPKTMTEYANRMKDRLHPDIYRWIQVHGRKLDEAIQAHAQNDYNFDWFSAGTLYRTYLAQASYGEKPCETPQQMYMRVAIQMYYDDGLEQVLQAYHELSNHYYTHASPTIFNAGMKKPQLASCMLMTIEDDLDSILYRGVGDVGRISKYKGGLGIDVSRVRHSEIDGIGMSQGIVPMLQVYNDVIRYVDQLGKRKGAATVFLRPHHIDIYDFCSMRLPSGDRYNRAYNLNYSLWFPWLFWQRVEEDGDWTLFCPAKTPDLNDLWGEKFVQRYRIYEQDPSIPTSAKRVVKARHLLDHIIQCQQKCGMPYIMHADACNMKSNHRHLGYIRSSNLCQEIVEYTSSEETAVCNLASISLRAFVKSGARPSFDFGLLARMTRHVTRNLNKVIDRNWYPIESAQRSNRRHRPIGIGVSGLAECFHAMDLPFDQTESFELNRQIFACMYFNALGQSVREAILHGPYDTFEGSPASQGKLQFDLWAEEYRYLKDHGYLNRNKLRKARDDEPVDPNDWGQKQISLPNGDKIEPDWGDLKRAIQAYGLRNSLLLAIMPTASTAQILRNAESVEAHQENIYSRKVISASYPVLNRYMVWDLQALGLWNRATVDLIQSDHGSIAKLNRFVRNNLDKYPDFPDTPAAWARLSHVQAKYRTMWELSQKIFLRMAAERGRYICQSQSTNIYLANPTKAQLRALHQYAHQLGLKTGMYYLRQLPAVDPIKFTVDPEIAKFVNQLDVSIDQPDKRGENHATDATDGADRETNKESDGRSAGPIDICNDEVCLMCQG